MLLGALWTPILEPIWSQLGSNWGWDRLQHGSKNESVPPIVCTAIGGTPAAASNRQQQTNEDPSWNPDGSNADLLSFCFQMFNSASRSLVVKGSTVVFYGVREGAADSTIAFYGGALGPPCIFTVFS